MNANGSAASEVRMTDFDSSEFYQLLPLYYRMSSVKYEKLTNCPKERLFPHKEMYAWLSYGNVEREYFARRELSFTLKGDIYTRFKSYPDQDSFSKELKKLLPEKIDIGAVYNVQPRDKSMYGNSFLPLEKELVFDIDMTDYDDVRTCCTGASVCSKCWVWMDVAIKVLHTILTDDFGFSNILFVYSGRRGVHCWVCDERARKLSVEARGAIADFITVITGGEDKTKKVSLPAKLHPTLRRIYDNILLPAFEKLFVDQKVLESPESQAMLLSTLNDENLKAGLKKLWTESPSDPDQKLADFKVNVSKQKDKIYGDPFRDFVFMITYPRLDVNVSIGLNHLLKSPFCVHPKTGRVCVPIDPADSHNFVPQDVPTISTLVREIDEYDKAHPPTTDREKALKDWKKTSMKQHIERFKTLFLRPLQQSIRDAQRQKAGDGNLDF